MRARVERLIAFGVPIGSFAVAFRMLSRQAAAEGDGEIISEGGETGLAVSPANDTPRLAPASLGMALMVMGGAAALMFYAYLELNQTVGFFYDPIRLPILTILCLTLCGLVLLAVWQSDSQILQGALLVGVAAVIGKLFLLDLPSWSVTQRFLFDGPYSFRDASMRAIDFAAVVGFFGGAYLLLAARPSAGQVRKALGFLGLAMLFIYLTLEVNTFLHQYMPGLQFGGVSILWSVFALVLIIRGIATNAAVVRYLGLALFVVTSGKVFFVDLEQLDPFYKIVAFVSLGILLLCGSFIYLKYRDKFTLVPAEPREETS